MRPGLRGFEKGRERGGCLYGMCEIVLADSVLQLEGIELRTVLLFTRRFGMGGPCVRQDTSALQPHLTCMLIDNNMPRSG
jgi:hypothetical protein